MKMTTGRKVVSGAAVAFALAASSAVAGLFFQGGTGVGDPYFPGMGNTGYDVQSYDVDLDYKRSGKAKTTTVIEAVADTDDGAPSAGLPMDRFYVDFRGPDVKRVQVNGAGAQYTRGEGQNMEIAPDTPIPDGTPFTVLVKYKGTPKQLLNPDGSRDGWTRTADGVVALGEPQAVPTFIPVNDHPTDKASWHFTLTTPKGLTGISNGELVALDRSERKTTSEWDQAEPMSSYLAIVAIGRYRLDRRGVAGIPYVGAVDRRYSKGDLKNLRKNTRLAIEFLETVAGPYPFSAAGGIADPSSLGFALENQSRSYYPSPPNRQLVIHENAHQWYGDSVAVDRWKEIWLNEGFATYMEWLYDEEFGDETVADRLDRIHANNPASAGVWNPPPADPGGPQNLFAGSVYDRGAMALQVLREEIGDGDFREVLMRWAQENEGANASTQDLYDLVEEVTGSSRPDSFDEWLYEPGKPDLP